MHDIEMVLPTMPVTQKNGILYYSLSFYVGIAFYCFRICYASMRMYKLACCFLGSYAKINI